MSQKQKILVSGDVEGNFELLFHRVNKILKKNSDFSLLLCVGEFFGSNFDAFTLYKNGSLKAPLPTYILGPLNEKTREYYADMKGCELAENIIYLGTCGIYTCNTGLKIAYLSGTENSSSTDTKFTLANIKSVELSAGNKPQIDILITSQWPNEVCNFVIPPRKLDIKKEGSQLISYLAFKLKPRYHFCGLLGTHYERLPYRNHQVLKENAQPVTRFVALAKTNNKENMKWLYAFNISPYKIAQSEELKFQPPDVTESPYMNMDLSFFNTTNTKSESKQFFYDMESTAESLEDNKKRKRNVEDSKNKVKREAKGQCWFCLSSPDVEKHLVISVGTYSYLALAKGGLLPSHLLILPIEHYQSTVELEQECLDEINQYKSSLKKMFKIENKDIICFERNYKSQHLQIQVVPLSNKLIPHVKETFMDTAESSDFQLNELPRHSDLSQIIKPGRPFFYVELPSGEKLFHKIFKNFDIHFGRRVLASPPLLNIVHKVDWRACQMSAEDEEKQRNAIRDTFKPFDFSLEDDDEDSD